MEIELKQNQLAQLEAELEKIISQRDMILNEIKEETQAKYIARAKCWNLQNGSCILLFAKRPDGYHWDIAKTLFVTEVDFKHNYFEAIETSYRESDYTYHVRCELKNIYFSDLESLEEQFNIYFVDEVQLAILQQHFLKLKLDYNNYKTYEDTFAKQATLSIKIVL